MSINEIKEYVESLIINARRSGKKSLILRSGDIHKELNLKNYMPSVCRAMYQCMTSRDIVLHTTPSGYSSTIEIEYKL